MATGTRPWPDGGISIGRIFGLALSTIRHNPIVTTLLAFVFGTLPGALTSYVSSELLDQTDEASLQFWGIMLLTVVLGMAVSTLTQAVLTRATVAESEGRRASLAESLMSAIAVLLPMIAFGIIYALAVVAGLILLIVPGLIITVAWYVATPALVEERLGIVEAIRRSSALTLGARWQIFGIFGFHRDLGACQLGG